MKNQEYIEYVEARAKKSPIIKDCAFAFLFGGIVCIIGQIFIDLYIYLGINEKDAFTYGSVTLMLISVILTGFGVFDKISRLAGAGLLVPITGFANAVASEAIDAKSEGYILGVGAKLFTIAGSVIAYGIFSGAIYGVIYYLISVFWG